MLQRTWEKWELIDLLWGGEIVNDYVARNFTLDLLGVKYGTTRKSIVKILEFNDISIRTGKPSKKRKPPKISKVLFERKEKRFDEP